MKIESHFETTFQAYDENIERIERQWYFAQDLPTAYIRAQKRVEVPWVISQIRRHIGRNARVLDLAGGVGLNANPIAEAGYDVSAIDLSKSLLRVAKYRDSSGRVKYCVGDAYSSPFPSEHFDVVLALDVLHNVSDPQAVIDEAYRLLKPGGLLIYNSFNKNALTKALISWGLTLLFRNKIPDFFSYSLFLNPQKIHRWLRDLGFEQLTMRGVRPKWIQRGFVQLLESGTLPPDFEFKLSYSYHLFFLGSARKAKSS